MVQLTGQTRRMRGLGGFILILAILVISCKKELIPRAFSPTDDHRGYVQSLEEADLVETALGQEWLSAAEEALRSPVAVRSPYQEVFYIDPARPEALGYRFAALRGHKIEVDVDPEMQDVPKLFIDLFRIENDSLGIWTHVASAEKLEFLLAFEPLRDADYIVRLQPELLRGGRYTVKIRNVPAFRFPVLGKSKSSILSFFGDPRDGGRREHHGVDIFASRHTPIISPVEGRVRFAGERGRGGQVVWLRDTKYSRTLYFAHLQTIMTHRNAYVYPGDTIGTVGNTGNARTTPPHLHFGIYSRGPIDPYHFIAETDTVLPGIQGQATVLGSWIRTSRQTSLLSALDGKLQETQKLDKDHLMIPLAAAGSYYRVRLPDGHLGYVLTRHLEIAETPLREGEVLEELTLLDAPVPNTVAIESLQRGEPLSLYGKHRDYWFVRNAAGSAGWTVLP
jgi:murein DD-endopeptidase MepM/ murein hydrolase activator NlpD